jgi:hypothetical protein
MFELKKYQKQALAVLEHFLAASRSGPVESAFEQALIAQKLIQKNDLKIGHC